MNGHLSSQQIEEWLIGERPGDIAAHIDQCPACSLEVRRAMEPLALFADAVRTWGATVSGMPVQRKQVRVSIAWRAALACAAVLALVAVPVYEHRSYRGVEATKKVEVADDVLLQQVAAGVARSVPAPMEPLARLMYTDSNN